MNNSTNQLKEFIQNYRKILLPLLLIFASVFLMILVIMPQFSSITNKMSEISDQNKLIATLTNSQRAVTDTSEALVNSDFDTATLALPVQKDISLVFDALTQAASETNTTVSTFAITVGGIYGKAAEASTVAGNPNMSVTASVIGDVASLVAFTQKLNETLPLSEISKIDISDSEAVLEISFYYKPVDASKIASEDSVTPLSQSDKILLNKLKEWEE
jgi:hypothetical protein